MYKISVFTNENSEICDFFDASRFLIFENAASVWEVTNEIAFDTIVPSTPAQMRRTATELLALLEGCDVLAGGSLTGIAFSIFDRAGLHIFEINVIDDDIFNSMVDDINNAGAERGEKEQILTQTHPIQTSVPGIFALDLVALQREFPEISSKKAIRDFLENTPFLELRLTCKHVPPWIENDGAYDLSVADSGNNSVCVIITKKCQP